MPAPANLLNTIRVVRGQTKVLHVTVKTHEGKVASLNGAKLYFTARESPGSTVLISLTSPDNGIQITDAANGKATVTMSSSDTDLDVGCYWYDLFVEFPGTPPIRHPVVKKSELVVEPAIVSFS